MNCNYCVTNYCTHSSRVATGDDDHNHDFVFEEFVRLRVAGVEEGNNETEA